jgi:peptidoglycan/xylan/chitin deacetylase (PgdA/CDA1 family)
MKIKQIIKYLMCVVLYYTGIVYLFGSRKPLILTYHRVVTDPESCCSQPGMTVSGEIFKKQLRYIDKSMTVVSLEQLVDSIETGRIVRCCVLTFDDGWLDVYQNAFPVMRALKIPATIFLATGFVGTDSNYWPERLTASVAILGSCSRDLYNELTIRCKPAAEMLMTALKCPNPDLLTGTLDRIIELLKYIPDEDRAGFIEAIEKAAVRQDAGTTRSRSILNWQEIAEMSEHDITYGAHTVNHVILTEVPESVAMQEIQESKSAIESRTGLTCNLFSYPNGDWDPEVRDIVEKCGYRAGVTTERTAITASCDLFTLGRVNVHDGMSTGPSGEFSRAVFVTELSGILDIVRGKGSGTG